MASGMELRYDAVILLAGWCQQALISDVRVMLCNAFDVRELPLASKAARAYTDIVAMRRSVGVPVALMGCHIATISRSRDMVTVARNVQDFEDRNIEVVDSWIAT